MERELILNAKLGNREAFDSLIKTYLPKLYRAAYFFLFNVEDAADICQEAFMRAYTNLNKFDEKKSFYPWIYTILKNLCFNYSKKRSRISNTELCMEILESSYDNPEENFLKKDRNKTLTRAIAMLPEMHREILVLKTYNDLSYEEIARVLDIPKGTVMSRLYNARQKLKNIMLDLEGGSE